MNLIGLGNPKAQLNVYIENILPLEQYQSLAVCRPMQVGEIKMIADETGNHWRKIFNVYAKIIFELKQTSEKTWQQYRDNTLLQQHSDENLLFNLSIQALSEQLFSDQHHLKNISIIMGKTYATKLAIAQKCHWLANDFAINQERKIVICPYFDYRQLSNIKISTLCQLIKRLSGTQASVN